MERILIIGSGGAGKSTLACQLGEMLSLPVIHLDRLYWYGNWQHRTALEFDPLLGQALDGERWIIDGNYIRTLPTRLAYCDTVLFLDYPTIVCLWGAIWRSIRWHGKCRPDMGGTCHERLDPSFMRWVLTFRRHTRGRILEELSRAPENVRVCILRNRRECRRFLKSAADIKRIREEENV